MKAIIKLKAVIGIIILLSASCQTEDESKPTLTGTVNINGTMEVGETLTAEITGSNGTAGKFTYKWTRTPNGGQAIEITSANSATYMIAEADLEHTLGAIIENEDTQGTISGISASKAALANTASRNFNNQTMFVYNDADYLADINDARTGARYKTLEQLGVITKLQNAFAKAFENASAVSNSQRRKYTNVFDNITGEDRVVINIENNTTYASYKVGATFNDLRFSIDYLLNEDLSDADLQAAIDNAVTEMKAIYDMLLNTNDAVRMAGAPVARTIPVTEFA